MTNKTSTGYYSTGNWSTGDYSTGNYSTGYCSTGNWSTGDYSTGYCSTGHRSTGNYSTGNYSTGNYSTGHRSTGNWSTGDYSTGYRSISNYSTWHFCTIDYMWYSAFNKPIMKEERENVDKPRWLFFSLTEWINVNDMTETEKRNNPNYKTTWWYLKVYDYKEAFQNSYNKATREEQLKIKELPNFDADIFYEISGIRIEDEPVEELTLEEVNKLLGKKIKIIE